MSKLQRRASRARARIMEIVATNLVNGTTPHPELLKYVKDRAEKLPTIKIKRPRKRRTSFYQSTAWRTLRYATLVKYGRRCQACGTTSGQIDVDHIKPRSKFPHLALDPRNVQVLCNPCNVGKSNNSYEDWR